MNRSLRSGLQGQKGQIVAVASVSRLSRRLRREPLRVQSVFFDLKLVTLRGVFSGS